MTQPGALPNQAGGASLSVSASEEEELSKGSFSLSFDILQLNSFTQARHKMGAKLRIYARDVWATPTN